MTLGLGFAACWCYLDPGPGQPNGRTPSSAAGRTGNCISRCVCVCECAGRTASLTFALRRFLPPFFLDLTTRRWVRAFDRIAARQACDTAFPASRLHVLLFDGVAAVAGQGRAGQSLFDVLLMLMLYALCIPSLTKGVNASI